MAGKQTKNVKNSKNIKKSSHGKQKRKLTEQNSSRSGNDIIDDRIRHDILGVVFIVLGVALFAIALVPTNAPLTSLITNVFRFIFGVGIFVLPFVLIGVGISFFFHMVKQKVTIRVSIGFSLIFVAVLTIIAISAPCVAALRYEQLFDIDVINNFGGIVGSSLAWLLCTLLGSIVSIIIMVGVILAGLVVLGLSVTKIIARIKERRDDIDAQRAKEQSAAKVERQGLISKMKAKKNAGANKATMPILDSNGDVAVDSQGNVINAPVNNDTQFEANQIKTRKLGNQQAVEDDVANEADKNTRILGLNNKATKLISDQDPESSETNNKKSDQSASNEKKKSSSKTTVISKNGSMPKPTKDFKLPDFNLLEKPNVSDKQRQSDTELKAVAENLERTLNEFNISANVVGWVAGPTVTLFKVDLPAGIRVSRITALNDDIALALAAPGVRVFAPIPGTTYVGIEVPNSTRQTVFLSEVLQKAKPGPLQIAIGKDVEGNSIISDLATMPHLLIGGTTGSGKSVSINGMIMSILMRSTPDEVRMILIDPKRVEFTPYNGIPHLMVPVVTEPKEAASALSWGVAEMERRLRIFSEVGVRNISHYNARVLDGAVDDNEQELEQLPYIVIIIDELADLMMAIGKEVEYSISRIAQLARAAGIHLIVATQRPSTNVVTGLIKANITNRIAFNVASGIDSRVIIDTGGAESLIGLGDLLLSKPELSKPLRIQGCYVSEPEIASVVKHLKSQGEPEYHNDILKTNLITIDSMSAGGSDGGSGAGSSDDSLFWEAAEMVVSAQSGSTSSLQRRFKIGYARAGRIMDMLEEKGIVGPQNGSKPREVLIDQLDLEGLKALEDYDKI